MFCYLGDKYQIIYKIILWHPWKFQPPGDWGKINYLSFVGPTVFMNKIIVYDVL